MTRTFKYVGKSQRIRVLDVVLEKSTPFSTDDMLLADVLAGFPADIEEVKEEKVSKKASTRIDADKP